MTRSERHEILFCHDLLKLLEHNYPNSYFFDDFDGHSRAEFYFSNNDEIYIVEAKSDIEAKSTPWNGPRFQDKRDAIKKEFPNSTNSKYARWLIYLAQLNDYAERFDKFTSFQTMLGLPFDRIEDAIHGIEMLKEVKKANGINLILNYTCESCGRLNVAYLFMPSADLSNFIGQLI
jgi:hypothetical protein